MISTRTQISQSPLVVQGAAAHRSWSLIPPPIIWRALLILILGVTLPSLASSQSSPEFSQITAQAAAARTAGDVPRAIDLYTQAVRLNPTWPEGWWYLGSLQYGASAYSEARDALTHFIALSPEAVGATAMRGLCEFETGEYVQALKDIQVALADGAGNQRRNARVLRAHEALLQTRAGKFEDALSTYAFFAQDGPPSPQMAIGIGLAGLRMPLLPKDVPPAQQDILLATGNAIFHFMAGDADGARQAFQAAFEHYPGTAGLHYVYGYFLYANDPDQAAAEFQQELRVAPGSAVAEAMLAWEAILHDNATLALPHAQRAVADDPRLPLAQLVLGRSMVDSGDLAAGTAHLEKALQLDPGNLENHLALASAYAQSGRKKDAYRERLQCLQLTKDEQVAKP